MNRFLFSHKIQTIAISVLIIDLIALFTMLLSAAGQKPIVLGVTVESILLIVLYLAVFFSVISREKVENAYVSSLRFKSLALVSLLGLAIVIILNVVQLLLPFSSDSYQALKEWRMNHLWNGNYIVNLAILYLIILKAGLHHYKRR